ncbi:MAG: ribosomal-protein-alanine N-acetyltransferase [Acidobacteria bacterium]|nr:MAG: ribosomal-protein-alanine N-acetyltransferase [Acidobacteriota bacterium]
MSAIDLLSCYALMPMNTDHLHEVELIERLSYSNPWPRDSFTHEIEENGFSHPRVAVTTDDAREVAGYCISWIVFETLQIQNVAVHPRHRRRGLARHLLLRAIEDCRLNSVIAAQLEVRASNVSAQKLYQTLGFRVVGERKKYYSRPREDAVLLQKRLR